MRALGPQLLGLQMAGVWDRLKLEAVAEAQGWGSGPGCGPGLRAQFTFSHQPPLHLPLLSL